MASESDRIGDRYVLENEIGAGGMGVVWRARDDRLGRNVALKLLTASAVGSEIARTRLVREARAAAKLQHDAIVHVYDVGETGDGGAFLVMELVKGESLRDAMAKGTLSIGKRLEIVVGVATALAYAHEAGIVHRDVKPDNVLVRENGKPVVLDFGLAKPIAPELAETVGAGEDSLRLTGTGNIVGTPAYLAPEQVKGEEVGPTADQFALAVMTFELVTGKLPWKGKAVLEVLTSMLHDDPPSAEEIVPELPKGFDRVLLRAMKRAPEERYPSVLEFAKALTEVCGELVSQGVPSGRISMPSSPKPSSEPVAAKTLSGTGTLARKVSTPEASKKGPSRIVALGAIALLGIAAVGIVRTVTRDSTTSTTAADAAPVMLGATSVVACPHFKVVGDVYEKRTGWLGAAAAALACDRIQATLGGGAARTLTPAELVAGIAREPVDMTRIDMFSDEGVDVEATKNAKERATAWVDGTVTKKPNEIEVEIVVRGKDDNEISRASGTGYELFEAVSVAVRAAKGAFEVRGPSEYQKEWLRVDSIDAALDQIDVTTAILVEDDVALKAACERAAQQRAIKPDMAFLIRALCHERLKRAPLDEPPPPIDTSSPGALVTTIAAQRNRGGLEEVKKRVLQLREIGDKATTPEERAIIAATTADLLYTAGDLDGARSNARLGVQLLPKLSDLRGTPWHRLSFASEFDRGLAPTHSYWISWEPVAVQNAGSHDMPYAEKVRLFGRGYLLGRRGYFATLFAEGLAHLGRVEESRNIAVALDDDHLRVRALIGEQKYRGALMFVTETLAKLPADATSTSRAFRMASAGAEAAELIGVPADFVDDLVKRFIDPEPPLITPIGVVPFLALVHACTRAPMAVAQRCIKRVKQIYARGDLGGILGTAPGILEGAELYLAKDYKGAAKAFRPMLRQGGAVNDEGLRHVVVDAFDRAELYDLADRADGDFSTLADLPGAMDLAVIRTAFRAEKMGNPGRARKLATISLERLRFADEDAAAMKDLQALMKRLPEK